MRPLGDQVGRSLPHACARCCSGQLGPRRTVSIDVIPGLMSFYKLEVWGAFEFRIKCSGVSGWGGLVSPLYQFSSFSLKLSQEPFKVQLNIQTHKTHTGYPWYPSPWRTWDRNHLLPAGHMTCPSSVGVLLAVGSAGAHRGGQQLFSLSAHALPGFGKDARERDPQWVGLEATLT